MNFAKKKVLSRNFLGGILLVCYKGYLSRTNPVEKASAAICSVKKHKMPVLSVQDSVFRRIDALLGEFTVGGGVHDSYTVTQNLSLTAAVAEWLGLTPSKYTLGLERFVILLRSVLLRSLHRHINYAGCIPF